MVLHVAGSNPVGHPIFPPLPMTVASSTAPTTPMPARVILLNLDNGHYVRHFKNELFEENARFGYNGWPIFTLQGVHQPAQSLTYELTGGTYRVTAGRGMSWRPLSTDVVVPDNGLAEVTLPLERIVDTEAQGWWVGDAHVHVIHGGPGGVVVKDEAFQRFGEAVGLNWISLCQAHLGDSTTNWAGQKAFILPHSNATFRCWMGAERPKSYLGHLAMINPSQNPWLVPDDPPYYEASELVRRLGGVTYPVHADRLYPGGDTTVFKYNNFYKEFVLDALLGPSFDAFSVISNSEGGYNPRLLGWWYALLQQGGRVAAMGDSDFNFQDEAAGMAALGNWVSYVYLSNRTFNAENVALAVREGRTFSSTGPLLFFQIDGAKPGDALSPGTYTATLDVFCAHHTWSLDTNTLTLGTQVPMGIKRVEIYRSGRLFKRWDNLNVPEAHLSWPVVETNADAFYTAHVQGTDNKWMGAAAAISNLAAIVSTVRWEFPLRYQFRNSYVTGALTSDLPISAVAVLDGPPLLATNARTAAMLVLDKTRAQPGDVVNYAAIYRSEGVTTQTMASGVCYLKLYAWDPERPSSYSTWVTRTPYEKNSGTLDLGNGYHAYLGAITIPAYATNCYQGPGLMFDMYIRVNGEFRSSLQLYMDVGPTRRELLVSTAWPGLPPNWPNHVQKGIGPCNLSMSSDAFAKPINDYRSMRVQLSSGTYAWQARLMDSHGRESTGATRTFTVLTETPDGDSDGLPDAWEAAYFTNALAADPDADDDHDGFNNRAEYRAGTNPRELSSRFEMREPPNPSTNGPVVLRWSSGTDRVYRVQRADTLLGAFITVASNLPATPPWNTYSDDTATAGVHFYRIDLQDE